MVSRRGDLLICQSAVYKRKHFPVMHGCKRSSVSDRRDAAFLSRTQFAEPDIEKRSKQHIWKGENRMKRNFLRRIALLLVLCMALGLAATGCGFESAEVPDNSTTDTSGNSTAVQALWQ